MSNFVLNSGLTDDMQAALDKAFEMAEGTAKERIRYIKAKFEENIRESTFQEEEAAAIRTEAGKDAVLATVQLDDPYADDIWANAPVLKQFMASGTKNPVEGADIKVRLLWDDEYLYVGYENFDTSIDDIKAATKYNDKGSWWVDGDDDVETFISADPSSGTYYGYFGNPHNLSFRYFGTGPAHDSDYNKPETLQHALSMWMTPPLIVGLLFRLSPLLISVLPVLSIRKPKYMLTSTGIMTAR